MTSEVDQYKGMTWCDIVRKVFPDADDEQCMFLLQARTSFPLSHAPAGDKAAFIADILSQLEREKKALDALKPGQKLCVFCSNVAPDGQDECPGCYSGLYEDVQ